MSRVLPIVVLLLASLVLVLLCAQQQVSAQQLAQAEQLEDEQQQQQQQVARPDLTNIPHDMMYMLSNRVEKRRLPAPDAEASVILDQVDKVYQNMPSLFKQFMREQVESGKMDVAAAYARIGRTHRSQLQDSRALSDSGIAVEEITAIVNVAKDVWKFIDDNRAVVGVSTSYANALPKAVDSAMELSEWQRPVSDTHEIVYKNLYGMKVVQIRYTLSFVPGGRYYDSTNDRLVGRYLDRITILPTYVNVMWGFKLDAHISVPTTYNRGSRTEPVAAAEVEIGWKASALNSISQTYEYEVLGTGRYSSIN